MDYRCLLYITINGSQSYHKAYTYQPPAQETKSEIPPMGWSLFPNHIIKLILSIDNPQEQVQHKLSIKSLTSKQRLSLWSSLINIDNSSKEYISSFSHFDQEFSSGNRLIDTFSNQFSFHYHPCNINDHIKNLNNVVIKASLILTSFIIILDMSIKNSVATSISHVHSYNKSIIKTIYQAINVTTTKTELFAIRCRINQAINTPNVEHIIVITNSIYVAERIFDSLPHLYQTHSAAIFKVL